QHLVLKKLYGKSQNAVFNQIYIAMIMFCLTLLMKHTLGYKDTLLAMREWLCDCWHKQLKTLAFELVKEPDRSSSGRPKLQHNRIIEQSLSQFESADVDHLNALSSDPFN